MADRICADAECDRSSRSRGYCPMHYQRLVRARVIIQPRRKRPPERCRLDGCAGVHHRSGLCLMHYTRRLRHGDPHAVFGRGEAHMCWVGDDANYRTMHKRLVRTRGLASGYACVDCAGPAAHWSYNHTDPDAKISEDGYPYSTDLGCYEPRCSSCHELFDIATKRVSSSTSVARR